MIARGENEVMDLYRGERPVTAVYRGEQLLWSGAKPDDGFRGIRGTALYMEKPDVFEERVEAEMGVAYEEILAQVEEEFGTREDAERYLVYMIDGGTEPPYIDINGVRHWLSVQPDGSFSLELTEPVTYLNAGDSDSDGNPIYTLELILDTSGMTSLAGAFSGGDTLTSVDMSGCDISNVENMSLMFAGCHSLVDLKMKGFGRSLSLYLNGMFNACGSLSHESLVYTILTHSFNRKAAGYHDVRMIETSLPENHFTEAEMARLNEKGYVWT